MARDFAKNGFGKSAVASCGGVMIDILALSVAIERLISHCY
jgi:hypothetical protein